MARVSITPVFRQLGILTWYDHVQLADHLGGSLSKTLGAG